MELRIRFIRHGLTASNELHKYLGKADEALSARGRKQLDDLRTALGAGRYLVTGPMRRCVESAQILFPDRCPVVIPEWTEIDFGSFEGKSFAELQMDRFYREWLESGGRLPIWQGESREDFIARSMKGYDRMLAQVKELCMNDREQHVVEVDAVVNGGTIMAVCSSLFGGDYYDYQIGCGGVYQCPAIIF